MTGIAAVQIGGSTLHGFAGVRNGQGTTAQLLNHVARTPGATERWRRCRLLVIDEVSMLAADLMDALDDVARVVRNRPKEPFGGIQLLLVGDFLSRLILD